MKSENGFSLLEALIAVFILSFGILGVAVMQINATYANATGMDRTRANGIARSFLEELKRLPYDDINLTDTNNNGVNGLNDGSDVGGGAIVPANADHQFVPANFASFVNIYQLSGVDLVDKAGKSYQLFWNVNRTPWVGSADTPYCVISLFMYWQTKMGPQHLNLTSIKYNNITL